MKNMTLIEKATVNHSQLLSEIATLSFIDSHGNSASPKDISTYVREKFNSNVLTQELVDPKNIYHIIYSNGQAAGYSKIVLNVPFKSGEVENVTKLERFYLLKEFYGLHLGSELFEFNVQFMKANHQVGVWLFVWKGNNRAVEFYKKKGFAIIGSHDFKISRTHSNPNHQMFFKF